MERKHQGPDLLLRKLDDASIAHARSISLAPPRKTRMAPGSPCCVRAPQLP